MRGEGGERGSHPSAAPPSTPFPIPHGCLQPHTPGTLFTALTVRAITLLTKREWTKSTYQKLTMAIEEETSAGGGRELSQHRCEASLTFCNTHSATPKTLTGR